MLAALISGLSVAVLTGLTILAYRHPPGYRKVGIPLMVALTITMFGVLLWNSAVDATTNELRTFFKEGTSLQAGEVAKGIQIPILRYFIWRS
jgi:hypothetical protein